VGGRCRAGRRFSGVPPQTRPSGPHRIACMRRLPAAAPHPQLPPVHPRLPGTHTDMRSPRAAHLLVHSVHVARGGLARAEAGHDRRRARSRPHQGLWGGDVAGEDGGTVAAQPVACLGVCGPAGQGHDCEAGAGCLLRGGRGGRAGWFFLRRADRADCTVSTRLRDGRAPARPDCRCCNLLAIALPAPSCAWTAQGDRSGPGSRTAPAPEQCAPGKQLRLGSLWLPQRQ